MSEELTLDMAVERIGELVRDVDKLNSNWKNELSRRVDLDAKLNRMRARFGMLHEERDRFYSKYAQYRNRALALVRQLRRGRDNVRQNMLAMHNELQPHFNELLAGVEAAKIERDAALAQLAAARELLESAYYQLDPIYLADGVTLHPGCVSTLHDLYAYLWPEGKAK